MSAPLLTHRPDFSLAHAQACHECWALALRGERRTFSLDLRQDRVGSQMRMRVVRRLAEMRQGAFG